VTKEFKMEKTIEIVKNFLNWDKTSYKKEILEKIEKFLKKGDQFNINNPIGLSLLTEKGFIYVSYIEPFPKEEPFSCNRHFWNCCYDCKKDCEIDPNKVKKSFMTIYLDSQNHPIRVKEKQEY
jgi:hypothetical protein